VRSAFNAIRLAEPERLAAGVYTASAGNMAQRVAWSARQLGVPATVVVPDQAPATKITAIKRLGGEVVRVPFDRWRQTLMEHSYPGLAGLFVHPVSDTAVMAGNGTIAPPSPWRTAAGRGRWSASSPGATSMPPSCAPSWRGGCRKGAGNPASEGNLRERRYHGQALILRQSGGQLDARKIE
jgi:hypothetical protein